MSDSRYDPWGLAGTSDAEKILRRLKRAVDQAAKNLGVENLEEALSRGDLGTEIHAELSRLLTEFKRYRHIRLLSEVHVNPNGIITEFGEHGFGAPNSLIKDVVVLKADAKKVIPGLTKAEDVTKLVVDLKTGVRGAAMRSGETTRRFGAPIVKVVPHEGFALFKRRAANALSKAGKVAGKKVPLIGPLLMFALADDKAEAAVGLFDPTGALGATSTVTQEDEMRGIEQDLRAKYSEEEIRKMMEPMQMPLSTGEGQACPAVAGSGSL